MSWPTYKVEVQWGADLTGLFRIDISSIGSSAKIGGLFVDTEWTDETANVKTFQITKGKTTDIGQVIAGTSTIQLWDTDGTYNPANTGSSLAPNLVPMRPVRITATWSGTEYILFYGFIQRITSRPRKGDFSALFEATDLFSWLAAARPTITSMGATTTGAAIAKVLDEIQWTEPGKRSLDAGDTIDDFSADGTISALTLIRDLLKTERGMFFVQRDSIVRFDERNARWTEHTAPDFTFTATMVDLEITSDVMQIFNAVSVTKTGGSEKTATDTVSSQDYGIRDLLAIDSAYLQTEAQAQLLANYLVWRLKDPLPPTTATFRNRPDTIVAMLAVELNDRVTMIESQGNTTGDWHVEGISHTVVASAQLHETRLTLTRRNIIPFIIGISTIDSIDVITY